MEQLSSFTTLKVGGPAQKIVHAHTEDELVEFVKAADKAGEKVLILGGAGFIGMNIVKTLAERGSYQITLADNLFRGKKVGHKFINRHFRNHIRLIY